jgi:predicted nucleic acid-binding protein
LGRGGQAIGMGDGLIAGIALAHGLPLYTRNSRHFERVAGLKLVEAEP